jgi:hypothetical protein
MSHVMAAPAKDEGNERRPPITSGPCHDAERGW